MHKKWTKEEDKILIANYYQNGVNVSELLPGRTVNAIKNRAQQLGLLYRQSMFSWSKEELDILKTYYPIEGKKVNLRLPGRSLKTIQVTAHRLGVKRT